MQGLMSDPGPELADAGPNCPRCGAPTVAGDDREPTAVWRCPNCGLELSERP
jgi:ribosomal protein L37AE/L43A